MCVFSFTLSFTDQPIYTRTLARRERETTEFYVCCIFSIAFKRVKRKSNACLSVAHKIHTQLNGCRRCVFFESLSWPTMYVYTLLFPRYSSVSQRPSIAECVCQDSPTSYQTIRTLTLTLRDPVVWQDQFDRNQTRLQVKEIMYSYNEE